MSNLRDTILRTDDTQRDTVTIPEWGGIELEVRSMTGKERARFLESFTDDQGRVQWEQLYPSLIIATCFDPESGERVFLPDDHDELNGKSGAALERIAKVGMRLSGMEKDSEEEAGKH